MKVIYALVLSLLILLSWAKTADQWKTRVIYQLITDRFSQTEDNASECSDLSNYCGGTFKGIEKNLDYIQGMGINAIWISPVVKNVPRGYHGYWPSSFYEINENFGTAQDLKDLIKACHERDIWVMVDIVSNHVASVQNNTDFTPIQPFNDSKYYHWPIVSCKLVYTSKPLNQSGLEHCWLNDLPDLDHEDNYVSQTLLDWIKDFVQTYEVDGLRLDATRHIPKWFLSEVSRVSGVFTIGEVWDSDISYLTQYQGPISSLLNFPFHDKLDCVFKESGSMKDLSNYYQEVISKWPEPAILGNFVGSHDLPRFLYANSDIPTFKSIYTFLLCSIGIPIIYYGDEQSFNGGIDPANREILWGKMNTHSEMYQYFKTINTFRQRTEFYNKEQIERFADDTFYAFNRGKIFFVFTNSAEKQEKIILSDLYADHTILCDVFDEKDCVEVKDGKFSVVLLNKQVKILVPLEMTDGKKVGENSYYSNTSAEGQSQSLLTA